MLFFKTSITPLIITALPTRGFGVWRLTINAEAVGLIAIGWREAAISSIWYCWDFFFFFLILHWCIYWIYDSPNWSFVIHQEKKNKFLYQLLKYGNCFWIKMSSWELGCAIGVFLTFEASNSLICHKYGIALSKSKWLISCSPKIILKCCLKDMSGDLKISL